jgi:outer membrane protein assembly factor BamB
MKNFIAIRVAGVLFLLLMSAACFGQLANSPWPRFHGNNQNTGLGIGGGSKGELVWKYTTQGGVRSSPAIAADGSICFGSEDGNVYMLNPDGSFKWASKIAFSLTSSPTIDKWGNVYIGSDDGSFYILNSQGTVQDTIANFSGLCPPVIAPDGTIYIVNVNDSLVAYDGGYNVKWQVPMGSVTYGTSPALGADGTIYVSTSSAVVATNPDGSNKWGLPFTVNAGVSSSPTVGPDGTIYAGTEGILYAINPDGTLKWAFTTDPITSGNSAIGSTPAIGADGTVYFGCDDGKLYAVNPDGTKKWSVVADGSYIESSPAIGADGTIYVGSTADSAGSVVNNVYAFNPDGSLQWTFATGNSIFGSPAIGADGTVYIGSEDGNLYALGTVNTSVTGLSISPTAVVGGNPVTGTVTISPAASGQGVEVTLSSSDPSASTPPQVLVPAGSTTAMFTINTSGVAAPTNPVITGTIGPSSASASLTVNPATLLLMTISPKAVTGGSFSYANVVLTGQAPPNGTPVTITSSQSSAKVPTSITIPGGQSSQSVVIQTQPVDAKTSPIISITVGGLTLSGPIEIDPPALQALSLSPTSIVGGMTAAGTVTLSGPAGPSGVTVSLSSSNAGAAAVTPSVTISEGATSGTFVVPTYTVAAQTTPTITAAFNGTSQTAAITVLTPLFTGLTVNPTSVIAGSSATGTIILSRPAPTGGIKCNLNSTNDSSVPPSITIPAGATTAAFTIKTLGTTTTQTSTISTWYGNTVSATLTVIPASVTGFTITPSTLAGGNSSTGTISLNGVAPQSGLVLSITSSSGSASVPSTVTIPAGGTSASFTISTSSVVKTQTATISASQGSNSLSQVLTIQPVTLGSFTITPTQTVGGCDVDVVGTVTLTGPAPKSGLVVTMTSSSPYVRGVSSFKTTAGVSTYTFEIYHLQVTSNKAITITASYGNAKQSAILNLTPFMLSQLSISPSSIISGLTATGTVTLNATPSNFAPVVVNLTSSSPLVQVTGFLVPIGSNAATFPIKTTGGEIVTHATITAKVNSTKLSQSLTITPTTLASLSISPSAVQGGSSATGTITLSAPARPIGQGVQISSNNPAIYIKSTGVTVPGGSRTATFQVWTQPVVAQVTGTLTAVLNGSTVSANLTANPSVVVSVTFSPSSVVGGKHTVGTVTLNLPAPTGGCWITFSSNNGAAQVQQNIQIPANKKSVLFDVSTSAVTTTTSATITATHGSSSASGTLTISP